MGGNTKVSMTYRPLPPFVGRYGHSHSSYYEVMENRRYD
jgi:hypothetical protein